MQGRLQSIAGPLLCSALLVGCDREVPQPPPAPVPQLPSMPAQPGQPFQQPLPVQPVGAPAPFPTPAPLPAPGEPMATPWLAFAVPTVPGWDPIPGEDHGPVNGYVFGYRHPSGITASVFVYNKGMGVVQRQLPVLQAEVASSVESVHQARALGHYQSARELDRGTGTLSADPSSPVTAWARLMIAQNGPERMSTIYVTTHRGYFFKVRVSLNLDGTPETEQLVRGLLATLAAAVRE